MISRAKPNPIPSDIRMASPMMAGSRLKPTFNDLAEAHPLAAHILECAVEHDGLTECAEDQESERRQGMPRWRRGAGSRGRIGGILEQQMCPADLALTTVTTKKISRFRDSTDEVRLKTRPMRKSLSMKRGVDSEASVIWVALSRWTIRLCREPPRPGSHGGRDGHGYPA